MVIIILFSDVPLGKQDPQKLTSTVTSIEAETSSERQCNKRERKGRKSELLRARRLESGQTASVLFF